MIVEPVTLEGAGVRLEPLDEARHREGIEAAIQDGELWGVKETFVPHPGELDGFFSFAASQLQAGRELAFATVDAHTGRIAGSTRFREIEVDHRRVEIGFTFVAGSFQRSHVNTAAKLLMLEHAFDTWGTNRVELLTDMRNEKSRAAIARIGGVFEGTLRAHMVMRDGHVRDTAVFSITRPEWPGVRDGLRARVAGV